MSQEVVAEKFKWSDLYKKEDWWAIWLGFGLIALQMIGYVTGAFNIKSGTPNKGWSTLSEAMDGVFPGVFIMFAVLAIAFSIGMIAMKKNPVRFIPAYAVVFALAFLAELCGRQVNLENYMGGYAFFALAIGLIICNTVGTPQWLKPAIQTEYFIKTGLVILGAEVLFTNITAFGLYGLGVAWFVTPIVLIFMYIYGTKFLKMPGKPMVMTIAAATSVCGVSAAIAAAAASKAKKEDLTLAVGLSLLFTVLMMIFMPVICKAIGLDPMVGGAWMGGTIDATGAVVLAGEALGPVGGQVAAMVKMIQNVLIGFIAFGIAIFFTTRVDNTAGSNVGVSEIWHRFPKFIIGFITASLVFSFIIEPTMGEAATKDILKMVGGFKNWCFATAFVSIGLESNFKEMASFMKGGKPLNLYIVGQSFNLVLTLLVAWILLSGVIIPQPTIVIQ